MAVEAATTPSSPFAEVIIVLLVSLLKCSFSAYIAAGGAQCASRVGLRNVLDSRRAGLTIRCLNCALIYIDLSRSIYVKLGKDYWLRRQSLGFVSDPCNVVF